MKKIILLLCLILCGNAALADKYPVKLLPAQKIATTHDEIETGDSIKFVTANDVYKNDKLYIKAGTPVIGIVDYIDENCWCGDNAEIQLKQFKTTDINGKTVNIASKIAINGFEELKYQYPKIKRFWNYLTVPARGKEVDITPQQDKSTWTIWLVY